MNFPEKKIKNKLQTTSKNNFKNDKLANNF